MTSYAVGILNRVEMGPTIVEYLQRIDGVPGDPAAANGEFTAPCS